ncbi:3-oxoacyl-[acyl-carrier-protein] synthase 3 [Artemisia annua]|uniref:3-oxoacyl-[acyl-carrier-protein] synthase 3 n=1 Tax=Artemisia annua TaxID=35608 RepID=A0A2U1Q0D7_ARTAN|nr:3-oxoacyl-[acyl-carrier-protein] synthase 3 [Artemisia annua]
MAELEPDDVDLILNCSSTPESLFGGTAEVVQPCIVSKDRSTYSYTNQRAIWHRTGEQLRFKKHLDAKEIHWRMTSGGGFKNVLVIGADCISRYVDWMDRKTCVLFGDAAGAILVQACDIEEDGLFGFTCTRMVMAAVNGQEVFRFVVKVVPQTIEASLANAGLRLSEIDWLMVNQANQRIIDYVVTKLEFPKDRVISNLGNYGNTSAASIPLALDEAVRSGYVKEGDTIMTVGFGAGLTWGSAIKCPADKESITGLAVEATQKVLQLVQVEADDVHLILFCSSTPEDLFGGAPELSCANISLDAIFIRQVGDGSLFSFWLDKWIGATNLKTMFPRLFSLELHKLCTIRDICSSNNGSQQFNFKWRRPIRDGSEAAQFNGLLELLSEFVIVDTPDHWSCSFINSKTYTVALMRKQLEHSLLSSNGEAIRWNRDLPIKINIHSWRISLDRIPTRFNLDKRGIDLHSTRCPVCDGAIETSQHLSCANISLDAIFIRQVGDGSLFSFWLDKWIGATNLKTMFPRLFSLELHKLCTIRDICSSNNGSQQFNFKWRRPIRDGSEAAQFNGLLELLSEFVIVDTPDHWSCSFINSKTYTVALMRKQLEHSLLSSNGEAIRWNRDLPIKINIHSWRISLDRIPTRFNLDKRGIDLHSTRCPVCDGAIETSQHVLVECPIAAHLWDSITRWWGLSDHPKDISSLITWSDTLTFTTRSRLA